MHLWESLNPNSGRSAGSIDEIANTIAQVRKQKQVEENTKRLRSLMAGGNNQAPNDGGGYPYGAPGTGMTGVAAPEANIGQSLERARRDVPLQNNGGPRGLADMSTDEIMSMGDILNETPELSPQVKMLQEAWQARQPKTSIEKLQHAVGTVTTDPTTNKSTWETLFDEPPGPRNETLDDAALKSGMTPEAVLKLRAAINPRNQTVDDAALRGGMSPEEIWKAKGAAKPKTGAGGGSKVLKTLQTDKETKQQYLQTRYPDVDMQAAVQGKYPASPTGRSMDQIVAAMQKGENIGQEEKQWYDKVKATDAFVKSYIKYYKRAKVDGVDVEDPAVDVEAGDGNGGTGGGGGGGGSNDKFVTGKTYKDGSGKTAKYLGNGKWQNQ